MRTLVYGLIVFAGLITVSCKDKDAEKKIAALEARLAELEGKGKSTPLQPTVTPNQPAEPEKKPDGPFAVVQFETTSHDFGTINEGDVVEFTYNLKNTGTAPLIIQNAQPSCGCTVPEKTETPIPPGGTGFVKAKFDSKGKPNLQNKSITVTTNAFPSTQVLTFKAMVTPKPAATEGPVKK
jgi:hypothetical protein